MGKHREDGQVCAAKRFELDALLRDDVLDAAFGLGLDDERLRVAGLVDQMHAQRVPDLRVDDHERGAFESEHVGLERGAL